MNQPHTMQATCPRCRHLFEWAGGVLDRPRCPQCHHLPNRRQLAHVAGQVARIRQALMEDGTLPPDQIGGPGQ